MGCPLNFFSSFESSYFCDLGAHAKNQNPTTPPYAILATAVTRRRRRTRKEKKITKNSGIRLFWRNRLHSAAQTKIVATFVCASSHGQRTHSARTNTKTVDTRFHSNTYQKCMHCLPWHACHGSVTKCPLFLVIVYFTGEKKLGGSPCLKGNC